MLEGREPKCNTTFKYNWDLTADHHKTNLASGHTAGNSAPLNTEMRLSVLRIVVSGTLLKLSTYFKEAVFPSLSTTYFTLEKLGNVWMYHNFFNLLDESCDFISPCIERSVESLDVTQNTVILQILRIFKQRTLFPIWETAILIK